MKRLSSVLVLAALTGCGFNAAADRNASEAQDSCGGTRTTCGADGCFSSESRWAPQLGTCEWNRTAPAAQPRPNPPPTPYHHDPVYHDPNPYRPDPWSNDDHHGTYNPPYDSNASHGCSGTREECGADGCFITESRWAPQLGICEWNRIGPSHGRRYPSPPSDWDHDHHHSGGYPYPSNDTPPPSNSDDGDIYVPPAPVVTPRPRPTPAEPVVQTIAIQNNTFFKSAPTAASILVSYEKCRLNAGSSIVAQVLQNSGDHIIVQLTAPLANCAFGKTGQQGYLLKADVSLTN